MICDKVSIVGLLVVSAIISSISCFKKDTFKSKLEKDIDCSNGKPNYQYYPYDCQKYFGCDHGVLKEFTCPRDLYWNEFVKACDVHENTDCSHIIPFPNPDCSDGRTTYNLYPYDCSKFWECFERNLRLMVCPSNYLWNDKINSCDERGSVDCSHIIPYPDSTSARPPTPSTTTTPTYTTPKIDCTYDKTYFPYPYDCAKFYECSSGKAILMDCDVGTVWNDAIKTCDYPYKVDCSYVISTPRPFYNVV